MKLIFSLTTHLLYTLLTRSMIETMLIEKAFLAPPCYIMWPAQSDDFLHFVSFGQNPISSVIGRLDVEVNDQKQVNLKAVLCSMWVNEVTTLSPDDL